MVILIAQKARYYHYVLLYEKNIKQPLLWNKRTEVKLSISIFFLYLNFFLTLLCMSLPLHESFLDKFPLQDFFFGKSHAPLRLFLMVRPLVIF